MNPIVDQFRQAARKAIDFLKEDLKSIRTGKANPSLVENLIVETYGGSAKLKLMEVATIISDGPAALSITPFDPSTTVDIEKAILKTPTGLSPAVQGNRIMVRIPPLSQEQREKYVKLVNQKTEERRNMLRNFRDEGRKKVKNQLEAKEISEDQKFRIEKELDTASTELMDEIQTIKDKKEKEIMEL